MPPGSCSRRASVFHGDFSYYVAGCCGVSCSSRSRRSTPCFCSRSRELRSRCCWRSGRFSSRSSSLTPRSASSRRGSRSSRITPSSPFSPCSSPHSCWHVVGGRGSAAASTGGGIQIAQAVRVCMAAGLTFLIMRQVMPMAAGLASGLALSSFGIVSAALAWGLGRPLATHGQFTRGLSDRETTRWDPLSRKAGYYTRRGCARRLAQAERSQPGSSLMTEETHMRRLWSRARVCSPAAAPGRALRSAFDADQRAELRHRGGPHRSTCERTHRRAINPPTPKIEAPCAPAPRDGPGPESRHEAGTARSSPISRKRRPGTGSRRAGPAERAHGLARCRRRVARRRAPRGCAHAAHAIEAGRALSSFVWTARRVWSMWCRSTPGKATMTEAVTRYFLDSLHHGLRAVQYRDGRERLRGVRGISDAPRERGVVCALESLQSASRRSMCTRTVARVSVRGGGRELLQARERRSRISRRSDISRSSGQGGMTRSGVPSLDRHRPNTRTSRPRRTPRSRRWNPLGFKVVESRPASPRCCPIGPRRPRPAASGRADAAPATEGTHECRKLRLCHRDADGSRRFESAPRDCRCSARFVLCGAHSRRPPRPLSQLGAGARRCGQPHPSRAVQCGEVYRLYGYVGYQIDI